VQRWSRLWPSNYFPNSNTPVLWNRGVFSYLSGNFTEQWNSGNECDKIDFTSIAALGCEKGISSKRRTNARQIGVFLR
jgi:hypothetical protein